MNHTGNCFCGAVEIEVRGAPEAMGYCHCRSCRSWSGGPVNAFSLWKPEAVRITKGEGDVATFTKTPLSERKYCKKCGGHLMTNHPPLKMIDVFAATLPTLAFAPAVHAELMRHHEVAREILEHCRARRIDAVQVEEALIGLRRRFGLELGGDDVEHRIEMP